MVARHACDVAPEQAGQRLDKFLSLALPHLSRSRIQQLIEEGHARRGGKPVASASYR
ncbi:MAG: S4 domain-containing protein [Alphaproteobacteria bacterium]